MDVDLCSQKRVMSIPAFLKFRLAPPKQSLASDRSWPKAHMNAGLTIRLSPTETARRIR